MGRAFANKFLVREGAINFGAVEECDAAVDCCVERIISRLSFAGPYTKLIPIQPSPMAETSRFSFQAFAFSFHDVNSLITS